jgi:DNA primase
MTIPPGFLEDVLARTSLARVVARKVTWDARRSNTARGDFWAPCPFHQEKTASFHVDDAKGFYYCFGCQAKGDAIAFLRESEGMGFLEAVETLARDAGIEMPARSAGAREVEGRRARLQAAMEAAFAFYRLQLASSKGAEARAYLDRRGLLPATRERFEIGFAPDAWTALAEHLTAKGFTPEEAEAAGLTKAGERGPYDRFRNRVVFPIRDAAGRPMALGGRALRADDGAKYLNSPETPLFDKGRSLFNLQAARAAAGRGQPLLVAEGYMDVVALVQAGYEAAVAPLGTAITEEQLDLLWRVAPEPLVALDGDAAGLRAAQRLIDLALPRLVAGRSLRFLLMPGGQDPDDVLRAGGRPAMEALIAGSQPIVELLWRRETEGRDLDSPERRAALDARLKTHLDRIADARLRAHTGAALRERYRRLLGSAQSEGRARPPRRRGDDRRAFAPINATPAARASVLAQAGGASDAEPRLRESAILLGLLNHPGLAAGFEERLERMTFLCPDLGAIRDALLSCLGDALPMPAEAGADPLHNDQPIGTGDERLIHAPEAGLPDRVAERLGRDPRDRLAALGPLRAHPHLRAGGDPAQAALAIEEEMVRHAATLDRILEVREAAESLAGDGAPDEGLTWRLRQAAEATERAARDPLADMPEAGEDGAELSRRLQDMIDREVWKKTRARRTNR